MGADWGQVIISAIAAVPSTIFALAAWQAARRGDARNETNHAANQRVLGQLVEEVQKEGARLEAGPASGSWPLSTPSVLPSRS
jgi:hypothetical protein